MLQALGVKFYDGSGRLIAHPIGGRDLINIEFVDFTGVQLDVLACRLAGLSDVDVPMVADLGRKCVSTLSFAPQKGVSEQELPLLEAGLRHWHDLAVRVFPGRGLEEYAGAAGGLGFALGRVIGADVAGGAKNLIYRYGLISPDTSLIITGEGCIDEQSMAGKVVGEIARQAKVAEIPVIAIGGRVDDSFHDRGSFAGVFSTEHYMPDAVLSPWVARQRLILAMLDVTPCVSRILNSVSR